MILIEPSPETTARIDARAALLRSHAWPIWRAVRDLGCVYANCPQDTGPFELPVGRPVVAVFGDDYGTGTAKGPDGFDRASLAAVMARAGFIGLVTAEAQPCIYVAAIQTALASNGAAVVVESLPEAERAWMDFMAEVAPFVPKVLVTVVEPEGTVH